MSNKTEITEFGVVGELDGEPIHYKEGKQEYGNYLRYKNSVCVKNHEQKCRSKTASFCEQQDWFIIAEDSAKLFPQASIEAIQSRLRKIPRGVEILQTGYRRCAEKKKPMQLLDLSTMRYRKEEHICKITKIIGQKLFIATRNGIRLLHHRLLKGKQDYFDTSMCELIRANVAIRDERPMAGSRRHYSLVDGGKWQKEEMPNQPKHKVTFTDLQEEILP